MKGIELVTLGLTPEQQERRRKFIGGSNALDIVTGGEAWHKLWLEKTGRAEPEDLSHVLPVIMGIWTEPLNVAWYVKQTGREVDCNGEQVIHPEIPYLGCTLDGVTRTEEGQRATFQAKHVGRSDEAMEIRYTAQCTHEALVLGYDHYVLSVFVGNNKWELYERELDPFFAQEYLEKCSNFWRFVETDCEPPAVEPLPVPPPRRLRTVDLTDSNEWCIHAASWLRNKPAAKEFEAAAKGLKSLVEEDVGLAVGRGVQVKRGRNDALYISEVR